MYENYIYKLKYYKHFIKMFIYLKNCFKYKFLKKN